MWMVVALVYWSVAMQQSICIHSLSQWFCHEANTQNIILRYHYYY